MRITPGDRLDVDDDVQAPTRVRPLRTRQSREEEPSAGVRLREQGPNVTEMIDQEELETIELFQTHEEEQKRAEAEVKNYMTNDSE